MHLKPYLGLVVASLLVLGANRAPAQAPPAASVARVPLAIGAGFSGYNPDYGNGHLLGGTLWIDYSPSWVPSLLRGVGLEVEAHDLHFGQSSSQPKNLRQDVASGGVFYSWPRYSGIRPYVNYQMGLGNQDYTVGPLAAPVRIHQSRTVTSVGGGVEFRASRRIWVRADYRYEFWPDFYFHGTRPVAQLNAQGFTIGALYHFSGPHLH